MFKEIFEKKNKNNIDIKKYLPKKMPYLIHVAGTNGKGSVCSYLEAVLMQKYKVGKFTSPHLLIANERITINQNYINDEDVFYYYNKIKDLDLGFFEIFFIIAMNYFADNNVDIAIIEVGIGGRMDTTNIIDYNLSIITSISLDHTNMLGNSLDEIAFEKSAVAKNNTICYYNDKILDKHLEKFTNRHIRVDELLNFDLPLKGYFQQKNFALAYQVFKLFNFNDELIKKGLKNFKILARQQYLADNILVDVSHNEDSISALISNIKDKKNIKIYMSVLEDKNIKVMYNLLHEQGFDIYLVPMPHIKRGRTKDNLLKEIPHAKITQIDIDDNKLNVFCGSFYFIAEVVKTLKEKGIRHVKVVNATP